MKIEIKKKRSRKLVIQQNKTKNEVKIKIQRHSVKEMSRP